MARVSRRPANLDGDVFVAEYHHVRSGRGDMFRTAGEFKQDLERFYRLGFRPVLASEYLANRMPLAPGASPVVFTFDDSNPSQIRFLPDGELDPECAVGIWQSFAKDHPDFPVRATFFVLPSMWGQPALVQKKLDLLRSLGCELGDHTITHPILRKLSDDKVKWEIGKAAEQLEKYGVRAPFLFAYPFGVSPRNRELMKGFEFDGQRISFQGAFLVGANPAPSPSSGKLNRLRIPRIQACHAPSGLDYWFDQLARGRVRLYVHP